MTRKWLVLLGVVFLTVQAGAQVLAQEASVLKTDQDKINYGLGVSVAKSLKRQGVEKVDIDLFAKGAKDEFSGGKLLIKEEELQKLLSDYQMELKQTMAKAQAATAENNKKAGDAFLAENKKKKGVVTTKSGLQYKILTEGKGKKPAENDTVEVNYKGTLIDGKVFDSSKGQPSSFQVKQVIPGWQEALKLMPAGSKWQVVIPAELAYGVQGAGGTIGPNSVLIFEVELVAIKQPEAAKP